jgi:hypothetical protein
MLAVTSNVLQLYYAHDKYRHCPHSLRIADKPTRDVTGIILPDIIALGIDSKRAIDMARREGPTKRTKHIDVKHHYLKQQVASYAFHLQQISTADQMADFLIKPLKSVFFQRACKLLHLTG